MGLVVPGWASNIIMIVLMIVLIDLLQSILDVSNKTCFLMLEIYEVLLDREQSTCACPLGGGLLGKIHYLVIKISDLRQSIKSHESQISGTYKYKFPTLTLCV